MLGVCNSETLELLAREVAVTTRAQHVWSLRILTDCVVISNNISILQSLATITPTCLLNAFWCLGKVPGGFRGGPGKSWGAFIFFKPSWKPLGT